MGFTHLDDEGRMCMVDVSAKPRVRRTARAVGRIVMQPDTVRGLRDMSLKKGDALAAARAAGIQAAKQTFALIPLCHNIRIDQVSVDFALGGDAVDIEARAVCVESTGIEMEALTAVSVAALTIYDMCKAVDTTMRIEGIRLAEKTKAPVMPERSEKQTFRICSLNISEEKGKKKIPVERALLRAGFGIAGDAHAGAEGHRQVSLLAEEDIDTMRGRGIELSYGDFAENITTRGIALAALPVGARLYIGGAVLEVTQIGKECHGGGCAIRKAVGECVMPSRGIFARVLTGGEVDCASPCYYNI